MPEVSIETTRTLCFNEMSVGQKGIVVSGKFIPLKTSIVGSSFVHEGEFSGVKVDFSGKEIIRITLPNRLGEDVPCVMDLSNMQFYRPAGPDTVSIVISL